MIKKYISIVLLILIIPLALFGCENEKETVDPVVINNGEFNIGMLVPDGGDLNSQYEQGFLFASELASSVYINDSEIKNNYSVLNYKADNVKTYAQQLVDNGASVIIFCGEDLVSFTSFTEYIKGTNIPVLSLSPYTCDYNRFYSLTLSAEYKASCSATYALDKGYTKGVVLCESDDEYYRNLAEIFKSTFKSYIGSEPTIYYKNGESANFSESALASGNFDYLLLICPSDKKLETVNSLRKKGFIGEIMFDEVFDHTLPGFSTLNDCAFMTKLENDFSNNISTVFYSQFSENAKINQSLVTSASAYGYDAYMTIFEALKSFSDNNVNPVFNNEAETSTSVNSESEITLSEFTTAIENVVYYGVTDKIRFKNRVAVPTYIYVDNIINSEIVLSNKYTFSDTQ